MSRYNVHNYIVLLYDVQMVRTHFSSKILVIYFKGNLFNLHKVDPKPPTSPLKNIKYLAIPPTPLPLRIIKMAPY